ncbi:tyrosine-type recombinase/integrase [Pseudomonas cichorii]|uniref:Tyr recombinase domain-containing protein n=1 Tax=Pseudomonas cichorii TaxID=36746 RepID=A0A3M4WG71_PSECI|nr:tyrosine-type recombinase/integrase [Pseudomonas cichorii]RMR62312.1 hypothetical protein ALP84_200047 [Pseudomonas cichorii]
MNDEILDRGLVTKADAKFGVPIATEIGRPTLYREGGGLPLLSWPDYTSCFEGNCWVELARSKGLKADTICQYSYLITPLLRYAFSNRLQLHQFDEYHFVRFMQQVKADKHCHSPDSNSLERVSLIGTKSLDFLSFIGRLYSIPNYVAENGVIHAAIKLVTIRTPNGKRSIEAWVHSAVPRFIKSSSTKNKLLAESDVAKIKRAVRTRKSKPYFINRERACIQVLEEVGARRGEVTPIPVGAVWEAQKLDAPYLRLSTLKKGGFAERLVEITPALLTLLKDYIEYDLTPFLKSKKLPLTATTPLFVSNKTNQAIQPNTVTCEFSQLKKAAGIKGPVHPHQFRHRSVSNDDRKNRQENPADEILSRLIGLKGTPEYELRSMEKHGHASSQSRAAYKHYDSAKTIDNTINGLDPQASSALRANLEKAQGIVTKGAKMTKGDVTRLEKLLSSLREILEPIPINPNE